MAFAPPGAIPEYLQERLAAPIPGNSYIDEMLPMSSQNLLPCSFHPLIPVVPSGATQDKSSPAGAWSLSPSVFSFPGSACQTLLTSPHRTWGSRFSLPYSASPTEKVQKAVNSYHGVGVGRSSVATKRNEELLLLPVQSVEGAEAAPSPVSRGHHHNGNLKILQDAISGSLTEELEEGLCPLP